MNEEFPSPDEPVIAEFLSEVRIRHEEVCARLGIGEDLLEVCLQWEIVEPRDPDHASDKGCDCTVTWALIGRECPSPWSSSTVFEP